MARHLCQVSAVILGLRSKCSCCAARCQFAQTLFVQQWLRNLPPVTPCQQPYPDPSVHKHWEQEQLRCHDAMSLSRVKFFGETTIAVSMWAWWRTFVLNEQVDSA